MMPAVDRRVGRPRLRRPTWPRAGSCQAPPPADPASDFVRGVARAIAARAGAVFAGAAEVAYGCAQRTEYEPLDFPANRAWRATLNGRELWCVLDDAAQAVLLSLTIGGPGAKRPTAMERAIVADCVAQLISLAQGPPDGGGLREEPHLRPAASDAWCCKVEIAPAAGPRAAIALFAQASPKPPPPRAGAVVDVSCVSVSLAATLPAWSVPLWEMLRWRPGRLLPLPAGTELQAVVRAGTVPLGRARIGETKGRRALEMLTAPGRTL